MSAEKALVAQPTKTYRRHKSDCDRDSGFDLLMTMICKMAFVIWKRYNGAVPQEELERLDEHGDWPRGLAARVMARLNRDKTLREQLEHEYLKPRPANKGKLHD